jgi:hypothetical protein
MEGDRFETKVPEDLHVKMRKLILEITVKYHQPSVRIFGDLPSLPTNHLYLLSDKKNGGTLMPTTVLTTRKDFESYLKRGMTLYDAAVPLFLGNFKLHLEDVQVYYGKVESEVVMKGSEEWEFLACIVRIIKPESSEAKLFLDSERRSVDSSSWPLNPYSWTLQRSQSLDLSFDIHSQQARDGCIKILEGLRCISEASRAQLSTAASDDDDQQRRRRLQRRDLK